MIARRLAATIVSHGKYLNAGSWCSSKTGGVLADEVGAAAASPETTRPEMGTCPVCRQGKVSQNAPGVERTMSLKEPGVTRCH